MGELDGTVGVAPLAEGTLGNVQFLTRCFDGFAFFIAAICTLASAFQPVRENKGNYIKFEHLIGEKPLNIEISKALDRAVKIQIPRFYECLSLAADSQ